MINSVNISKYSNSF